MHSGNDSRTLPQYFTLLAWHLLCSKITAAQEQPPFSSITAPLSQISCYRRTLQFSLQNILFEQIMQPTALLRCLTQRLSKPHVHELGQHMHLLRTKQQVHCTKRNATAPERKYIRFAAWNIRVISYMGNGQHVKNVQLER